MGGRKRPGLKKPNPGWLLGSSNLGSQVQKLCQRVKSTHSECHFTKDLTLSYDTEFSRKLRGVTGLVVETPALWWTSVTSVWIYALSFMGTAWFSRMLCLLLVCLEQQDCGYRGTEIWSWNTDVLKRKLGNNNLYSFWCVYRICNIYTSQNNLIKITFSLLIIPKNLQILQSTDISHPSHQNLD